MILDLQLLIQMASVGLLGAAVLGLFKMNKTITELTIELRHLQSRQQDQETRLRRLEGQ